MQYDANKALIRSEMPDIKLIKYGKVRDIYDLGDAILLVASDRISAFDVIMPNGIPDKGKILTQISNFWFDFLSDIPNHLISTDVRTRPELVKYADDLDQRSIIVKKTKVVPVECIVRGYITGSGWKSYLHDGTVCGIKLRDGYSQAEKLDQALFTPSTKAEAGHDENISFAETKELIGEEKAAIIKDLSLKAYTTAAAYAREKGIILADTKFEFGEIDGEIIMIDEALTPDSSRFWPMDEYKINCSPPSLDKQFVRDYLETLDWGKTPPGPVLPDEVVEKTAKKYFEACKQLTGKSLCC